MSIQQEKAGTNQSCIGSKAHSCYNSIQPIRLTRKPASITPLTSLATNKPSPSNSVQQQVSLACGKARGSEKQHGRFLGMSTVGSRKDLRRLTLKMRRRC